jgi:hypothetical protein
LSSWDGNIAGITKGTFEVKTDSNSGLKFVTKTKDELTKIIEVTTKRKHPVLCLKTQGQDIAQFYPLKNISVKKVPFVIPAIFPSHDDKNKVGYQIELYFAILQVSLDLGT